MIKFADNINPGPGNGFFCDVRRQLGVFLPPRHISNSRAHSNKIATAIPIFSVSSVSMVQLPVSRDVNIRQKSNMAAAKVKCTYFKAVWLAEDNFKYTMGDFQCSRQRCADPGMPLMTDMGKTKMAAETGSSFNFG